MIILKLYKLKKKFLSFFIILIIFLSSFLLFKSFLNKRPNISVPVINSINNSKFISEEALIRKFNSVNKLITLELELSQVVTIDQSYGDLDLLKKYKKIKFYSDCSYYIDLSQITKDDLLFDEELNILNLTVPNPKVYKVIIDKEKSKEETSVNGFLRFGEIKLTTEEFKDLEIEIINNLEEKLNNAPLFDEAKAKTKVSIENLVKDFVSEDVTLNISFK
jgi:hypothetical protein